jgi:N-acetylglucosamine kinase-like BadF-type ATPase
MTLAVERGSAMPQSKPDLLLGVDGGGHTTHAVIATLGGDVLGRGLGPPSNHHTVGLEGACRAMKTAIDGALAQVSSSRDFDRTASWTQSRAVAAACFGLAGVDGPHDEALFADWLAKQGCAFRFRVTNDAELILGGGTPDGWGVAQISGIGSVCLARSADGRTTRVGGWGHLLGDEGSGFQMALEALKLATQAADGRGGSPALLRAALNHWRVKEPKELIGAVYESQSANEDILNFSISVLDLAARNDPPAKEVVERAAKALALQIDTAIQKLKLDTPPLALSGAAMRVTMKKAVLEKITSPIGPVVVVSDPVRGAVATARRLVQGKRVY